MFGELRGWVAGASALLGMGLAGCAQLHISQDPGTVILRTANYDSYDKTNAYKSAPPVAARLAPYALIAEQSENGDKLYAKNAVAAWAKGDCAKGDECPDRTPDLARAENLLGHWRLAWSCVGKVDCHVARPDGSGVDGLGVQVWTERGPICNEAIIAFRGTQGFNQGDWTSNFHWLYRLSPVYDQYSEVRDNIWKWVDVVRRQPCYRPSTRIATLGHSLGGGLAQMAAYADGDVRRVYAFDPSPVTGFYSGGLGDQAKHVEGLRTERIYEHGEILAFARYVMRQFVPLTNCDARIVSVRFSVLDDAGPLATHSMSSLATGMLKASEGAAPERSPLIDRDCRKGEPEPEWPTAIFADGPALAANR